MKKLLKIFMVAVMVISTLCLVACSKYGTLKRAFEKAGFEESEQFETLAENIKEQLEQDEYVVGLHCLVKKDALIPYSALVIEFKATKDLVNAYKDNKAIRDLVSGVKDNEDVKAMQKALEDAGYAKGNCLVVPLTVLHTSEITDIVKGA